MRRISVVSESNIVDKYRKGENVSSISKTTGYGRGVVYRVLKEWGNKFSCNMPVHDITGQKFGFLTVIKMERTDKSTRGQWRAICYCDNCGNDHFDANPSNIKRGLTTSCGCRRDQYKKVTGKNNVNFKGYEDIRGRTWARIRKAAEKRGYIFEVTIQEAWHLYLSQDKRCALSRMPIVFGRSARSLKETTASLDRKDSNEGYSLNNVQWVHKDVNIMKNVFSQDYFINICRKVHTNNLDSQELNGSNLEVAKGRYFGQPRR